MTGALRAAWARRGSGERLDEGILAGPPLEAAHHELARFYRDDEAAAFDLWETGVKDRKAMIVLIAEGRSKKHRPIFLGMRADGGIVRKGGDLPPGARRIVRDVEPL